MDRGKLAGAGAIAVVRRVDRRRFEEVAELTRVRPRLAFRRSTGFMRSTCAGRQRNRDGKRPTPLLLLYSRNRSGVF